MADKQIEVSEDFRLWILYGDEWAPGNVGSVSILDLRKDPRFVMEFNAKKGQNAGRTLGGIVQLPLVDSCVIFMTNLA